MTTSINAAMMPPILVINGAKVEWLPPLQEALNKAMRATAKTWALAPTAVTVMNEAGAMTHGLILQSYVCLRNQF